VRTILIVEDTESVSRGLARLFRTLGIEPIISGTLARARNILEGDATVSAMVLDLALPDGSGMDFLEETSTRDPRIPTMVLTGDWTPDNMRRAQTFGALFLPKPASPENLQAFVDWAYGSARTSSALQREVRDVADRVGLTPRETDVLLLAAQGMTREEMRMKLGVSGSTLKTLVRRLIRRADTASLGLLVSQIQARVFGWSLPEQS